MLTIIWNDPTDAVIAEAERCRLEARAEVERDLDRYGALKDQPSGWCVVTQKRFWSRVYHNGRGEERLRGFLDRGHQVLLIVGIVAKPESPLNADTHLASVRVVEPGKMSELKFNLISARAKLHAAQALIK